MGLDARPSATRSRNSAGLWAMPPPWPPIVKPGRTTAGSPTRSSACSPSAIEVTISERGTRRPAACMVSRNRERSSARRIAS